MVTDWRSIRAGVDLVAGKWDLAVVAVLADGMPLRKAQIHRQIAGVSRKVLSETLYRMQTAGLVSRQIIRGDPAMPEVPEEPGSALAAYPQSGDAPAVGYTLTPAARALLPGLPWFGVWFDTHRAVLTAPGVAGGGARSTSS
jgi:HxlR-like helix-turn-helix